jgi:hypothetical protein
MALQFGFWACVPTMTSDIKQAMKIWNGIALASALMIGAAEAHSDPRGDVHPSVSVMDGMFVVDFVSNRSTEEQDRETAYRAIWSHDGKLLVPRHRLPTTSEDLSRHPVYEYGTQPHVFFESVEGKETHRVVLRWPDKKGPRSEPLPMTVKSLDEPYKAATTTVDQGMVAFTWGDAQRPHEDNRMILNLGLVSRHGFVEGETIPIGEVATIYSFPRVSNPVWAAKRWWIAWIKKTDAKASYDDPKAFTTMLSSYDPMTKHLTHEPLPGESTWNTTLSLATTRGWLCAAWHTNRGWEPLQYARIMTAFHRLPEP